MGAHPVGPAGPPWLTLIEDDHSRAVAGYGVNLGAPSALTTALAFRQAIWRKPWPDWHVCGIPGAFHVDHGSDFTSAHPGAGDGRPADPGVLLPARSTPREGESGEDFWHHQPDVHARPARVRAARHPGPGRAGPAHPGRAGRGSRDLHPGGLQLTPHGETGIPPQQRWEAGAFIPRMPDSLEQLDLLLLTVAKPRKIHPDGIHFQGLRYLDPVLAAYVGDTVVIRYDPRDMAEIRVFTGAGFLCRAICPELAGATISLKDITAARNARRRGLARGLRERASVVDRLLAAHQEQPPAVVPETPVTTSGPSSPLKLYRTE